MKNLFLTGPSGCGKSTAIARALGDWLPKGGGFLTVRQLDEDRRAVGYFLQRPDGSDRTCIIDYSRKPYTMHLEVFEGFASELLKEARNCDFVVLDEIGGFEVLSQKFLDNLMALLESDTPCIGVMKGSSTASKMICKLGLGEVYTQRAERLRDWMRRDDRTTLYECTQFDPEGLSLAREWAGEHCK